MPTRTQPAGRTPAVPTAEPGRRSVQRRRRQFLPPQHGAWAMLVVPYVAALAVAGTTWVDLPLAGAWLAGYLLSYYAFQTLKSRRPRRYRDQLLVYAALALPLAAVVVWARPAVLWYAPAYATLLSVNAWYAWRRRERALLNDLAAVLQSCLMVFVAATVAGTSPATVAGVFIAVVVYFSGTAFYVKTMIRERDNRSFRRWSVGYHLGALGLGIWLGPALAGFFAWLLVRSWALPRRRLVPKHVGFIEIGNCALLLAAVALTWG